MRPNVSGHGSIAVTGLNGVSVVVGFVIYITIAALIGPEFAIPVIATFLVNELGQVLAYRMLGHDNARFRLVPFINKTQISDKLLTTDGDKFFVSIMGPAFCLGPIALAATIATMLSSVAPATAQLFWIFAITCGAVNFVLLMPFSSLPGGRCTSAAVVNFWPALAPAMTVFMSAAMFTASLRTGSVALMVMAGVGAHSLWRRKGSSRVRIHTDYELIAMGP
ncbi:MAG: hypothetical protein ACU0C9_12155, partial [Paracoccaceae bacterium]